MIRYISFSLFLFSFPLFIYTAQSQDVKVAKEIKFEGVVGFNNRSLEGVKLELRKNNRVIKTITSSRNGKYEIPIEINSTDSADAEYELSFTMPNMLPKTVTINTFIRNPLGRSYRFNLDVDMIEKKEDDIVIGSSSAKISWNERESKFAFAKKEASVIQRVKEPVDSTKKQTEELAKVKAQEEAKKQAESVALKKAEEAKKKADAVVKKAEEEAKAKALVEEKKQKEEALARALTEEKKRKDEEAKIKAEKQKQAEEEALKKAAAKMKELEEVKRQEEAAAIKKAAEESQARAVAEEKKKAEAEALKKATEDKKQEELAAIKKAEEEAKLLEESKKKTAEESHARALAEEKKKAEAEVLKKATEEKKQEELAVVKKAAEEEKKVKTQIDAKAKLLAETKKKEEEAKVKPVAEEKKPADIPEGSNLDTQSIMERQELLINQYPEGVTEEIFQESNYKLTKRTVVKNKKAIVYYKKAWNWGGVFYFKEEQSTIKSIGENTFNNETTGINVK